MKAVMAAVLVMEKEGVSQAFGVPGAAINRQTVLALGLSIPRSILVGADLLIGRAPRQRRSSA